MNGSAADVAERFRWQAGWCGKLGSPLYRELMEHAADDIERRGPAWAVLESDAFAGDGLLPGAQALRLMGAVHRLVLEGRAPELARFYPSVGGAPGAGAGVREAFIDVLREHHDVLTTLIGNPVQTNEPGRSAGLMGGFLELARRTALPLRLLEIGASAGLNLRWDRYFYAAQNGTWGDRDSPVRFDPAFAAGAPPLEVQPEIAQRCGCDPDPLDAADRGDQLTLMSYVWPDQEQRVSQLRGAFEVAATVPVTIERERALQWLDRVLAEPCEGVATVVFHSVVLPYLGAEGIAELKRTLEAAGARATEAAPFAWMSMEPGADQADVLLTVWPGGKSRVLAHATFHGPPVSWLD